MASSFPSALIVVAGEPFNPTLVASTKSLSPCSSALRPPPVWVREVLSPSVAVTKLFVFS